MYQSGVKERLAHDEWAAVMHKIAADQDRKAFAKAVRALLTKDKKLLHDAPIAAHIAANGRRAGAGCHDQGVDQSRVL